MRVVKLMASLTVDIRRKTFLNMVTQTKVFADEQLRWRVEKGKVEAVLARLEEIARQPDCKYSVQAELLLETWYR